MVTDDSNMSSVRVKLGSTVYRSQHAMITTAMQEDDNQEKDINSTTFDYDSDIEGGDIGDTTKEKSAHQIQLNAMERDSILQSQATALLTQKIQKLEAKAESYTIHPDNWSKDRQI